MQSYPYMPNNQPSAVQDNSGCYLFLGILIVACIIVGVIQFHYFIVYQTYEQGSCTLLSGGVIGHGGKHPAWTVSFRYTVSTKAGRVESEGYDLPKSSFFSRQSAQSAAEQYTIGKSYPCWYNPQKPTLAALVLHRTSLTDFAWVIAWRSAIYIGLLFILLAMVIGSFYGGVYLPVCLMVQGIVTQGRVHEHITRRKWSGGKKKTQKYSCIVYQRQESPYNWQSFEVEGTYAIGSWQPVCYDPSRSTNIRRGHRPLGIGPVLSMLLGFALVLGTLAGLAFAWNIV